MFSLFVKRIIRSFRIIFIITFDSFLLSFHSSKVRSARVLIVKLDAIGDFVIWLDAAKALRDHYHALGHSVVLLGNKSWAGWAREMGLADEVWEIDVSRFRNHFPFRWHWLRRIRMAGFMIAIQPTCSRAILEGDSLVRASGALERLGSTGDEVNISPLFKAWSNRWYTRLIPATPIQLMELKRNVEFMHGLGFTDFQARLPSIRPEPFEIANLLPRQPYAVLVPGASWDGREWLIDNFIKVGVRLIATGLDIVVVGAPADRERASFLIDGLSGEAVDLVSKTTLGELAEVIRRASIVLTNETSAVHIAVAVDVPVVCILGGGHFGRFVPYEIELMDENRNLPIIVAEPMSCYGCNWNCQYPRPKGGAVKCIQDISVEKVWDAVETVLAKHS